MVQVFDCFVCCVVVVGEYCIGKGVRRGVVYKIKCCFEVFIFVYVDGQYWAKNFFFYSGEVWIVGYDDCRFNKVIF